MLEESISPSGLGPLQKESYKKEKDKKTLKKIIKFKKT